MGFIKMSIQILSETPTIEPSIIEERFLNSIESDIKSLFITHSKDKNRQTYFNSLILELGELKKANSNDRVFNGFNMSYFRGLFKEAIREKQEKLKEITQTEFKPVTKSNLIKMAQYVKNCLFLKPQFNGLEVIFKPTTTEINLVKSKNLRF